MVIVDIDDEGDRRVWGSVPVDTQIVAAQRQHPPIQKNLWIAADTAAATVRALHHPRI